MTKDKIKALAELMINSLGRAGKLKARPKLSVWENHLMWLCHTYPINEIESTVRWYLEFGIKQTYCPKVYSASGLKSKYAHLVKYKRRFEFRPFVGLSLIMDELDHLIWNIHKEELSNSVCRSNSVVTDILRVITADDQYPAILRMSITPKIPFLIDWYKNLNGRLLRMAHPSIYLLEVTPDNIETVLLRSLVDFGYDHGTAERCIEKIKGQL